jgi:hypothetical protein
LFFFFSIARYFVTGNNPEDFFPIHQENEETKPDRTEIDIDEE